jgi:hypothetical protein
MLSTGSCKGRQKKCLPIPIFCNGTCPIDWGGSEDDGVFRKVAQNSALEKQKMLISMNDDFAKSPEKSNRFHFANKFEYVTY